MHRLLPILAVLAILAPWCADAHNAAHRRLHFRDTSPEVVFLCHFDGADAATEATDVATGGNAPHAIVFSGAAALSTTAPKYGTASLLPGGGYVYCANDPDFSPGANDYTVEMWFKTPNTSGSPTMFFSPNGPTDGAIAIDVPSGAHLPRVFIEQDASNYVYLTATTTVNDGAWHHIAVIRNGNVWTLALDGVAEAQETHAWDIDCSGADTLKIGTNYNSSRPWDGYVDEVRISRGAQYTSFPFTPSGPFTP